VHEKSTKFPGSSSDPEGAMPDTQMRRRGTDKDKREFKLVFKKVLCPRERQME
jgi:hypothetical protein